MTARRHGPAPAGRTLFQCLDEAEQKLATIVGGLKALSLVGSAVHADDDHTAAAIHYFTDTMRPLAMEAHYAIGLAMEKRRKTKHPDDEPEPDPESILPAVAALLRGRAVDAEEQATGERLRLVPGGAPASKARPSGYPDDRPPAA